MSKEDLLFYAKTDLGRQRSNNEDAFVVELLDGHTIIAAVIDGVGGYEGGEVAAQIAQMEIPSYLKEFNRGERLELLKQAVTHANNEIYEHRIIEPTHANMCCVLTSVLIDAKRKVVDMVHVGDTRLYQYHHGVLTKLSHDHSLVGYREEVGDLTEEQAMHHPQRNVINRDVGSTYHEISDNNFIESDSFPLLSNTTFLLCSDGLTDLITSQQISAVLSQSMPPEEKVQTLINMANEAGGKDNITVVIVEYQPEEDYEPEVTPIVEKPVVSHEHVNTEEFVKDSNKKCLLQSKGVIAVIVLALAIVLLIVYIICQKHFDNANSSGSPNESEFVEPAEVHTEDVEQITIII